MKIPNDALTNAVRSLNYTFKLQTDRMMVFKKRGGTHRVLINRRDLHDEDFARNILRQAGMSADGIEQFISTYCRRH